VDRSHGRFVGSYVRAQRVSTTVIRASARDNARYRALLFRQTFRSNARKSIAAVLYSVLLSGRWRTAVRTALHECHRATRPLSRQSISTALQSLAARGVGWAGCGCAADLCDAQPVTIINAVMAGATDSACVRLKPPRRSRSFAWTAASASTCIGGVNPVRPSCSCAHAP
jgi:hypothetical protein